MLTTLKLLLKGLMAPLLFMAVFVIGIVGAVRRADWPLLMLAVLAPLPTVWYQLHQFPLGNSTLDLLFIATLIGVFVNRGGFDRSRNGWVVAIFLLGALFALVNVSVRYDQSLSLLAPSPALADWKNYAQMIFLYFLAHNALKNEEDQKRLLVIMAVVFFFIALREFRNFSQSASFSYDKRAEGPFWIVGLGANHFGAFIAHFGALLFGMWLIDTNRWRRWLYLAACVFCLHSLFFAYSRGAYLAAVAVLLLYALLRKRSLFIVLLALVFTWQQILPETVVERVTMTETADGEIEESAADRLKMWQYAQDMFEDNRVIGVGYTGFRLARSGERLTDPHNYYMKVAAEQGLLGLATLGLLLGCALLSGWRLYRIGRSDFQRALGLGFLGCSVAVCITNIFGDRFSYFAINAYFFLAWGMVDRSIKLSMQPELARASAPTTMVGAAVTDRT